MKIRITESKLKQIIRESVAEAINEGEYDYSEENGVSRKWLRNNSIYSDREDIRNYKHVDKEHGTGELRKKIEDAALNDRRLATYFSEPSNDIQELRSMLVSFIEENVPAAEKDITGWAIMTGEDLTGQWVNDLMWKMREKYRSERRPTTRESIEFLKKNFRDYDENMYGNGDKAHAAAQNIIMYVRDNDPYLYKRIKDGGFRNIPEIFSEIRRRYKGMWEDEQ